LPAYGFRFIRLSERTFAGTSNWNGTRISRQPSKPATVFANDFYPRSKANEKLFRAAQNAVNRKSYESAISSLRQLLKSDPLDFQAWTELGTVYLLQQNLDEAERGYLTALHERPSFFLASLDLGRLYLIQKKFEKAVDALAQAVKVKPESADANYFLGEAYLQAKRGSIAVGYFNAALRLDPQGMAEVHLRLAALYNGAGIRDKAATEYEEFLKKRPDYPDKKKLEKYIAENKKP
jgi:tetratricopeptide (TPR) repeat protein